MRKRWFAGGTVVAVSAEDPFFVLKTGVEAWEDGSLHFMAPPTICLGFKFAARLGGFPAISAHACAVAEHLAAQLAALRHANGAPAVVLYRERPGTPGVVGQVSCACWAGLGSLFYVSSVCRPGLPACP